MTNKYDLSKLTEEEKDQLKDYVNAIRETKKAANKLLEKAKSDTEVTSERLRGGPRKNLVMSVKEEEGSTAFVPPHVMKIAARLRIPKRVEAIADWLSSMDKKIVGGTSIGKGNRTLVLDLPGEESVIYYDADDKSLYVRGKKILFNREAFLKAMQ